MVAAGIRSPLGRALREAAAAPQRRVVVPDPDVPVRLHVAGGQLTEVECGGTCVRGLGHDLQALLVLARRSSRPRWGAEPDQDRPRPARVAIADVLAACEAAVTASTVLPAFWVDPRVTVELGAGPDDRGEVRLRHGHWRVVRALLVGGLPAVAADDAWDVVAEVMLQRCVAVQGAHACPVLAPVAPAPAPERTPIGVPPPPGQRSSTVDTVTVDPAAVQAALARTSSGRPRPGEAGPPPSGRDPQPSGSMVRRTPGETLRGIQNGGSRAARDRAAELRATRQDAERAASSGSRSESSGPTVEPDTLRRIMQRLRSL